MEAKTPEIVPANSPNADKAAHLVNSRFQKGKSGNKSGRPRGNILPALNRELKKIDPERRVRISQLIAGVLVKRATETWLTEDEGRAATVNIKAIDLIMKHTDPIVEEDTGPNEITVNFVSVDGVVKIG